MTLLHQACELGVESLVQPLLDAGASPYARTSTGITPLMLASKFGRVAILRMLAGQLLQHETACGMGWDRDDEGWGMEHHAAANGHTDVLQALLELHHPQYFPVNLNRLVESTTDRSDADSEFGDVDCSALTNPVWLYTPLMMACAGGHKDTIELLLQHSNKNTIRRVVKDKLSLLHWCCGHGFTESVRLMLGPQHRTSCTDPFLNTRVDSFLVRPWNPSTRRGKRAAEPAVSGSKDGVQLLIGVTPLGAAVTMCYRDIVELLMEAGANTRAVDTKGHTALTLAVVKGHLEVVRYLVSRPEVDANAPDSNGRHALTIAAEAGAVDIVQRLLLMASIDPGVKDKDTGSTALHLACSCPKPRGVLPLVLARSDADVNARDAQGRTPLIVAVGHGGKPSAVRLLLKAPGVDTSASEVNGQPVIAFAVCNNSDQRALQLLLDHGLTVKPLLDNGGPFELRKTEGTTYLHIAAGQGSALGVETLLEAGAHVNGLDGGGRTALSLVCGSRSDYLYDVVTVLLDQGRADPNTEDKSGLTPVVDGIRAGNLELVELLQEHGAILHPTKKYKDGWTLLHYLAEVPYTLPPDESDDDDSEDEDEAGVDAEDIQDLLTLLLDSGADVNAKTRDGHTPLMLAAKHDGRPLVEGLLEAPDIDVNAQDKDGCTALMLALPAERRYNPDVDCCTSMIYGHEGTDLAVVNNDGENALLYGLRYCGDGCAIMAIRDVRRTMENQGMQPDSFRAHGGRTMLHYAVVSRAYETWECLYDFFRRTSRNGPGPDVNARDDEGRTPFMYAAAHGMSELVKLMLREDDSVLDIRAVDNRGRNALMYACDAAMEVPLARDQSKPDRSGAPWVVERLMRVWPEDRLNAKDQDGHTAFTLACRSGTLGALEHLLRKAPEHVDTGVVAEGRTGLEWACAGGHWSLAALLAHQDAVKPLPVTEDQQQHERRLEDLTAGVASFLQAKCVDKSLARAVVLARPSTLAQLRTVPGMPHIEEDTGPQQTLNDAMDYSDSEARPGLRLGEAGNLTARRVHDEAAALPGPGLGEAQRLAGLTASTHRYLARLNMGAGSC